ncbi:MAG: LptF/LptG family permease [Elusimicrobia bacterium]|nr:LptF/LptG family permease [Elusimicrobiota bacterium]
MTLLGRYATRRFLAPFFFGLGAFALAVFLADVFDKMNRIFVTKAPLWVVAEYLGLSFPYWAVRVVPMATLLAAIFAVTGLLRSGEFIGVQSSGVRPLDFFKPLLWMALLIAAAAFLLQETLLPACCSRAQALWRERIHPEWEWNQYNDVVLVGGQDQFVTTERFFVREGVMERPVLDDYGPNGVERQIDAKRARWSASSSRWVFEEGVERRYEAGRVETETPFRNLKSAFSAPPKELMPRVRSPEEMSLRELRLELKRARRLGEPQHPLKTALQAKLAYPFTNIVLCALGLPVALRLGRASRPASFAAALVLCFLYLWLIETGRSLGGAGRLAAAPAAWLPHLVFGAAALQLWRSSKI